MRGKFGLVLGLGIGYVLGTRAGRDRYEQIKTQAEKVWELDAVQKQVYRVKDAGRSAALALPRAAWNGAVKLISAVTPDSSSKDGGAKPAQAQPAASSKPAPAKKSPAAPAKPAAPRSAASGGSSDRSADLERAREKIDEAEGPAANERPADES